MEHFPTTRPIIQAEDAAKWNERGARASQAGAYVEAASCFARAFRLDPSSFEAVNNLAVTLQRLGDWAGAEKHYEQALLLSPGHVGVALNRALLFGATGRPSDGLALIDGLLRDHPGLIQASLIGAALEDDRGHFDAGLARIEQALAFAPDDSRLLLRRAELLQRIDAAEAALDAFDALILQDPTHAEALHGRALALQALDRCDEALAAFTAAKAASSAPASIMAAEAWLLAELGRKPEALSLIDAALTLEPTSAKAWLEKASLTHLGDAALTTLTNLVERPETSHKDRIGFSFAIGKAHLDRGDGSEAFAWLDKANREKRKLLDYDPRADADHIKEIASVFSEERLAQWPGIAAAGEAPVFIFGMPRSGTTLVEHVLASHPQMHGLGEPPYLMHLANEPGLLARIPALTPAEARHLAKAYIQKSSDKGRRLKRTVDKTPSNFLHAGLIRMILPGAKMIHCRRDPHDTCLSLYSMLFAQGYQYCYDLEELGDYYRLYLDLMAHWRRVLPASHFLEVDYESLVRDPPREIGRLLAFCELPWDDACLTPHRTQRRVTSASLDQVRSQVYRSSVGRADRFRPWLERLGAFPTPV